MNDENPPDFTKLFAKMKKWKTENDWIQHLLESIEKVNNERWEAEKEKLVLRYQLEELEAEVAELRRKNLKN